MTQYRKALIEDAAAICALIHRAIRESCIEDHQGDERILHQWLEGKTPAKMADWLASDNYSTVVCVAQGELLGVGSIGKDGVIHLCYVHPEKKRLGIGKGLIATLLEIARDQANDVVRLVSTKTAKSFYEANGFIAGPSTVLCYGIPGYPMTLQLPLHH